MRVSCLLAILVTLCAYVSGATVQRADPDAQPITPRTLILSTQPATIQQSHSTFFSQLAARGHSLTFSHTYDDHVKLQKYGQYLFDNLVLFTSNTIDFSEHVTIRDLIRFVDDGQNLLLVLDNDASEPVKLLAHELGFVVQEQGSKLIDHFHYERSLDNGDHSIIYSNDIIQNASVIVDHPANSILFKGVAHQLSFASISATSRSLYIPILSAEASAYSLTEADATSTEVLAERPLLVSAYQTRTNTRVTVCGSPALFSNAFFAASIEIDGKSAVSGNEAFVSQLGAWAFRDAGVLRAVNLTHHHPHGTDMNPFSYRVNDVTTFSVTIQEFDGNTRTWKPFVVDDMQLEFTLMDPYIRMHLPVADKSTGQYSVTFTVPDVYGIYKFVVDRARLGYSHLHVSHQVSVTPYRHDQFERFLFVAYPYYTAVATLMGAFLIFGVVFLYQRDEQIKVITERTTVTSTTTRIA